MAAAGGCHAGRLEDVLLQEFFIGDAGQPFHQQGQQVVAGVGVVQPLPRGEVGLRLGLPEEAQYLVVAWHSFFFLPDVDEPIGVVEVIGDAAGVIQQMPHRHAFIGRQLREVLRDPVLQAQLALSHQQHDSRPGEGLADRSQLKDRVLRDRQLILRVPEAESSLGHDLSLFRIEPSSVEDVFFLQCLRQGLHHFMFIHRFIFLSILLSQF